MAKISTLNDPSVLAAPPPRISHPSERTLARRAEYEQLRAAVSGLTDPNQVFEVQLEAEEKAATVRQRLMRAAEEEHKEIAVRKYRTGFAVGLMTPERRSNRGRPRRS